MSLNTSLPLWAFSPEPTLANTAILLSSLSFNDICAGVEWSVFTACICFAVIIPLALIAPEAVTGEVNFIVSPKRTVLACSCPI